MKDLIVDEFPESRPSRHTPRKWWRIQWSLRSFLIAVLITGFLTAWIVQKLGEVRPPTIMVSCWNTSGEIRPDDNEIVTAARRVANDDFRIPKSFVVARVSKELMETRTDPVRTVPLIGPAALHHKIYRYKLYGQNNGVHGVHVVFVDLNHFQFAGSTNHASAFELAPKIGRMPSANDNSWVK